MMLLHKSIKKLRMKEKIAEVDEAKNMHRISLGRRILRTETAGMAILSVLMFRIEERNDN